MNEDKKGKAMGGGRLDFCQEKIEIGYPLLSSLNVMETPNNCIQSRPENGTKLLVNLKIPLPFSGG